MNTQDFSTSIKVDQTPEAVFNAVTNVRGWWSEEVSGDSAKLNDEFQYRFKDVHHCHMRLIEVVPNKKVVWQVLDNYFKFTDDKNEWIGDKIIFEISKNGNQTLLDFRHEGLEPAKECFTICRDAWTQYITVSLYNLITTGKGKPNLKESTISSESTASSEVTK